MTYPKVLGRIQKKNFKAILPTPKYTFHCHSSHKVSSLKNSENNLSTVKWKLCKNVAKLSSVKNLQTSLILCKSSLHVQRFLFQINCQKQLTKRNLNHLLHLVPLVQFVSINLLYSYYEYNWKNFGSFPFFYWNRTQCFDDHCPNLLQNCFKRLQKNISPQNSLFDLSRDATPSTQSKNSLQGSNFSLDEEMKNQEASSDALLTVKMIQKVRKKTETCEPDSSNSPGRKYIVLNQPVF